MSSVHGTKTEGSGSTKSLEGGISSLVAAAHELKSPLALMRQLALSIESGVSDSDAQIMLRQITLTSERALRLTNDLTKVARLEDAMFTLEPINPAQICEDIVQELSPLFKAHGRTLRLTSRSHSLLLVANRDLLRRIVTNFSDNALYYAHDTQQVQLSVSSRGRGETIRVSVRDFGPSLSPLLWKTLKAKLAHAPQSVHARPQSSGLGLYIAREFAHAMKGDIGVIRHRDGATFYVELSASRQLSLL